MSQPLRDRLIEAVTKALNHAWRTPSDRPTIYADLTVDAILAQLAVDGYTVAQLEQVGWWDADDHYFAHGINRKDLPDLGHVPVYRLAAPAPDSLSDRPDLLNIIEGRP